MASIGTLDPAPRRLARTLGFVAVTLAAFALDVLTIIPGPEHRDGTRFTVWGSWDTTVVELVSLLALVYAVLLARRRAPLLVLTVLCGLTLAFTQTHTPSLPTAAVLVTLYCAGARIERRWRSYLALALVLLTLVVGLLLFFGLRDPDVWGAMLVLNGLAFSLWVFGRRDQLTSATAAGLPDRLAEHEARAAEQERRRIAHELHDIVAHSVSAMMMQAAGARAVTAALRHDVAANERLDQVERALASIEGTGSQSMRELHRLLSVLREDGEKPRACETESSSQPGVADIARLVEVTRRSGLVVEVHAAGPAVRLDPSVGLAAYRVVQEALTNAMKHAGRGAIVDVFLNWLPDGLQLQVRCRSGHEADHEAVPSGGNGLAGLHERVELIGGTFDAGRVGDEFVATALLPLTPTQRPAPEGRVALPEARSTGRGTGLEARTEDPASTGFLARARLQRDRLGSDLGLSP